MSETEKFKKWHLKESDLENLTSIKARDLIIECFYEAQKETFRRAKKRAGKPFTDEEIHKSVVAAIRSIFKKINGDFDYPNKESLSMVVASLAQQASQWGTPQEIIEHHKEQVYKILDRLPPRES